jgi:two-component system chemotaxis response regulator CheB
VLVVLHVPSFSASNLPAILDRAGPLKAEHARDHEPLVAGRIYVAPPDFHLLAEREEVRVVRSPHEHNHRPAIDPLFRSVALAFGPAAIALVLTGALNDGAAGAVAVAAAGGSVVVQDPKDAFYPDMPSHAIAAAPSAKVTPLADIPALLDRMVREPVSSFVLA